jgi:hypothetical protein
MVAYLTYEGYLSLTSIVSSVMNLYTRTSRVCPCSHDQSVRLLSRFRCNAAYNSVSAIHCLLIIMSCIQVRSVNRNTGQKIDSPLTIKVLIKYNDHGSGD